MRRNVNRTAIAESAEGSTVEEAALIATSRENRLEQLRVEVQAGTYEVSADALAKALIEDGLIGNELEK